MSDEPRDFRAEWCARNIVVSPRRLDRIDRLLAAVVRVLPASWLLWLWRRLQ